MWSSHLAPKWGARSRGGLPGQLGELATASLEKGPKKRCHTDKEYKNPRQSHAGAQGHVFAERRHYDKSRSDASNFPSAWGGNWNGKTQVSLCKKIARDEILGGIFPKKSCGFL